MSVSSKCWFTAVLVVVAVSSKCWFTAVLVVVSVSSKCWFTAVLVVVHFILFSILFSIYCSLYCSLKLLRLNFVHCTLFVLHSGCNKFIGSVLLLGHIYDELYSLNNVTTNFV